MLIASFARWADLRRMSMRHCACYAEGNATQLHIAGLRKTKASRTTTNEQRGLLALFGVNTSGCRNTLRHHPFDVVADILDTMH